MYHHQAQQQGPAPFSNGPRPAHHQQAQSQQQNRPASDMLSGFQFPRPTQLPEELESALAIRGARDMDHRLIDHLNRPNQHQSQGSSSGISSHGGYGSNSIPFISDNQGCPQQGVDWSSYQPPSKLFASAPSSAGHQNQQQQQQQQQQGPQQQVQSSHTGTSIPSWGAPASDLPPLQSRNSHSASGEGKGLYTPESAGSILASFGLSNEDLEVLSHYPDDQLTPDTLPFILRDIQINKSSNQKTVSSASSSSFSNNVHDMPMATSRSPEVPSLLTVTQTAGKVIDYGHASRAKEDSARETFKREQLSSERTVKMYQSSPASSAPKVEKAERRQIRLDHVESNKHGDRDYRRTGSDNRKSNRSPGREVSPASKSRNMDRDYRHDGPKQRPSSETRSEASSRRSLSSSSGTKLLTVSKKLPTPTMISDFSAVSPKVYPHTCSLCHIPCDHEKDWVDHINTVNHTAACRDLRNKYPDWKPDPPSRRHGSQPKNHPSSHSVSPSLSYSPTPSPPRGKFREGPSAHRHYRRPYSPQHPRHHRYLGGSSHSPLKHPYEDSTKRHGEPKAYPHSSRPAQSARHGPPPSSSRPLKSNIKPGTKTNKLGSAKVVDMACKPPAAKKKKKIAALSPQDSSIAGRLVYLTGIPTNASEQEVTDLAGSFGKINNVILMPCSEEESEKGEGQKASVCMVKAEDAQALANSTNLSIRDQKITASVAKKPEAEQSIANNSKPIPGSDKGATGEDSGGEIDQKISDEKGIMLITGLPESGWSESDLINLVLPFGTPSDIIIASSVRKALVSVPDMETAEEMVKVHSFVPAKIIDCDVKLIHLKQHIGINTPVALYNLLMGSLDPLETPVGWSSLLVIRNVPDSPASSAEVQKLVRRFGTVIKTLVLNNMVICEMATAAMALSVFKRFQRFPCIIQNNPLFFSRKADPKVSTQTKVIAAYLDPSEETPANIQDSKTTMDEEETVQDENSESPMEGMEKEEIERIEDTVSTDDPDRSNDDALKPVDEDQAVAQNASNEDKVQDDGVASEANMETNLTEMSVVETEEAAEANAPAVEETSNAAELSEFPKVTQEMMNAVLVEYRTRAAGHPDISQVPTPTQTETQMEMEGDEKPTEETNEPAKNQQEKDMEEEKKQERERKDKELRKEKEARERKEKERRAWEKEHRARRDREREERIRKERERKERERRERERRDRKRAFGDDPFGFRSSYRSEGYKQSWKDEHCRNSKEDNSRMEEEEWFDEFPFNLSDFVTLDEVGEVTDLPQALPPPVPMETTEAGKELLPDAQPFAPENTFPEASTAEVTPDTTVTALPEEKSDEPMLELNQPPAPATEAADGSSADSPDAIASASASPAPQTTSPSSQSQEVQSQQAALSPTSAPEALGPPDPAVSSPGCPTTEAVASVEELRAGSGQETETMSAKEEEEEAKPQRSEIATETDLKEPPVLPRTDEQPESQTVPEQEAEEKAMKTKTDDPLPPFDPQNPVGMEYLVPKTGFFCKVCNRFFSGSREAEIAHCKSLKHYENLQKYLEIKKTTVKPNSS